MPVQLKSGRYAPKLEKEVYVWPKPDVNGDGDVVYEDKYDPQGNVYGQDEVVDNEGNAVHRYSPPEGFINKPSFDGTEAWVLADEKGRIRRNAKGFAYPIREGQTVVIHPDGSYEHLEGDYARTVFANGHALVGASEE